MSNNSTQTARSILNNREAIRLAYSLREECKHYVLLEHALYTNATPVMIESLEVLIGVCRGLRGNTMTDEDKKIRKYMMDSIRPSDIPKK